MAGDQPLKFPTKNFGLRRTFRTHKKPKPSTIKLEKTDLSKKSFYVSTSWIKLKTCSQELTSIVSADMNVQSPVDIFFSEDIVWNVMREQEFCWQEINLKFPMRKTQDSDSYFERRKQTKKKPSKSIKLDGKDITNTSYNVIFTETLEC